MRRLLLSMFVTFGLLSATGVQAADYAIDTKGAHAFIQFRVKHLGYSWLYGRFNDFSGQFSYDAAKPESSEIEVLINTASVDSNHAERDKHIRNDDFLDVEKFPEARFVSTKIELTGDTTANIHGNLTLKDVTKEVVIEAERIGMGDDPWGGYRAGFQGSTTFKMKDFNIMRDLGPLSQDVEMILSIEGIRK